MRCRLCRREISGTPEFSLPGMPGVSQHLPETPEPGGVDLGVVECPACGMIQLVNDPVPYYREVIRATAYSPEMGEFRRKQFAKWVAEYRLAGGRILEPGCGRGEFLKLLRDSAPVEVFGAEYGEAAAEEARAGGLRVERSFFERGDERLADAPFDGFFTFNYLEHLPDPGAFLRGIAANLREGAVGIVEVPNFDPGKSVFSEFTIDHLSCFTADTLRKILEINGFDVLNCRVVWHGYNISAEVRKRRRTDLSHFAAAAEKLRGEIAAFCGDSPAEELAVWGAGHQTFALLASPELKARFRCIIDSAKFKQGRYAPASALPIVAPDVLDGGGFTGVVVVAGAYSDEIVSQIRGKHGGRFRLAVVRENRLEVADRGEASPPPCGG